MTQTASKGIACILEKILIQYPKLLENEAATWNSTG